MWVGGGWREEGRVGGGGWDEERRGWYGEGWNGGKGGGGRGGMESGFFFNDTATAEIYTLSVHDALPI